MADMHYEQKAGLFLKERITYACIESFYVNVLSQKQRKFKQAQNMCLALTIA